MAVRPASLGHAFVDDSEEARIVICENLNARLAGAQLLGALVDGKVELSLVPDHAEGG